MAAGVQKNKLSQSQPWHVWGNLDRSDPELFNIKKCKNHFEN